MFFPQFLEKPLGGNGGEVGGYIVGLIQEVLHSKCCTMLQGWLVHHTVLFNKVVMDLAAHAVKRLTPGSTDTEVGLVAGRDSGQGQSAQCRTQTVE